MTESRSAATSHPGSHAPAPCEVWLVRHGITADNRQGIVQGHRDVPLDAEGEAQARRLGAWFAQCALRFDAVVASDLSRAVRTAELCRVSGGDVIRQDPAWREGDYGELEGRSDAELHAFREAAGEAAARTPPRGGESLLQMQQRVLVAFARLTAARPQGRTLLVTHGGPIAALITHVLRVDLTLPTMRAFRRDNTGVTVLRRRSPQEHWQLATMNDTTHLLGVGGPPGDGPH